MGLSESPSRIILIMAIEVRKPAVAVARILNCRDRGRAEEQPVFTPST